MAADYRSAAAAADDLRDRGAERHRADDRAAVPEHDVREHACTRRTGACRRRRSGRSRGRRARRPAPDAAAARARRETPRRSAPGSPRSPTRGSSRSLPPTPGPAPGPTSNADVVTPSSRNGIASPTAIVATIARRDRPRPGIDSRSATPTMTRPASAWPNEKPHALHEADRLHVRAEKAQAGHREHDRDGERDQHQRADVRRPQRPRRLQVARDRVAQILRRAHFRCSRIFFIPRNARVFAALTRIPSRAAISTKLQPST